MKKTQINNIRNSRVDIITEIIDIKRIIGEYYKQLHMNTFNNIKEHN